LTHDLASESFALVVGNPPYGQRATGLKEPVEAAFLRRAVELCRPGGWIALILPDGLLANRRAQGLRAAVLEQAALRLVLALPPSAFRSQGAAARTALVILEKRLNREGEPSGLAFPPPPTPSPRGGGIKEARIPIRAYVDDRPALVLSAQTPDDFGPVREAVARSLTSGELVPGVRAIATVGPYQRWDPGYWDRPPSPFIAWIDGRETVPLGHYIEHLTYGPIITGSDPEPAGPVPVIGQRELGVSGLNLSTARRVRADGPHDPPRSRVREGDLLVARSGVGGLGKGRMAVAGPGITGNVSCFVDLVRLRGLDPVFAWLFLASSFGQDQIRPLINGVGTPNLSFSELRSLQIPVLPEAKQRELASLYVEQVAPHHQAFLDARGPEDTLRMRRLVEEVMRRVLREFEQALLAT